MKKVFSIIAIATTLFCSAQTNATTKDDDETNCYNKWAQKIYNRGAEEITDGTYDDVIVTFRKGANADCFTGKVEVKNKRVLTISILREDGSYEDIKWETKSDDKIISISNGISSPIVLKDSRLVNVIWHKKIKPKKAPFKKAPDPTDD